MPIASPDESPEREKTDEGLREERDKTDRALAASQVALEADADAVVEHARDTADAVLAAAREKADEHVDPDSPNMVPAQAVADERAAEDAALSEERDAADESTRRMRESSARVLRRHLPLERDATDQYLLTERARSDDALATRDDFLGMVCHDLRDLLNGIMLSSAMLTERIAKSGEGKQGLVDTTRIQRYAERMNRLIGDLVDVASIDAGKLANTPSRGDAATLVAEAVDALQAPAAVKGIVLEAHAMGAPLTADFDHDRMLQVLANLIANSIKFTPKGGSIRVTCERKGEALVFCVRDSGQGIPASMLEAVFERFWQVGKDDRRGLGLGLYISKCIVEAHGGAIRAESTLGEGTRMHFTLPVASPA
jgi:signal transduction histidine kinase